MKTPAGYQVVKDERNPRVWSLLVDSERLRGFAESCAQRGAASRLAIPAERFRLTDQLEQQLGHTTVDSIRRLFQERDSGALTMKLPPEFAARDAMECLMVALGHLLGVPRCDANNNPLAYLESTAGNPFLNIDFNRTLPLHTDGTYYDGATDWIILALLENTVRMGGEALLLHVDDWLPYTDITADKQFRHAFRFEGPSISDTRKKVLGTREDVGAMVRPMFFEHQSYGLAVRIAHQWVHPQNFEEARFITRVIDSLAEFEQSARFALEENELYIINNNIWLHGRYKTDEVPDLKRVAVRCFGEFRPGEV